MRRVPLLLISFLTLTSCSAEGIADPTREFAPERTDAGGDHPVVIHSPRGLGVLDTAQGVQPDRASGIACETCHEAGLSTSFASVSGGQDAERLHRGVGRDHGSLGCASCHATTNPTHLRLASGELLPMEDALTLCSQCHGHQRRDYDRGAHGGMTGYWDLRRGPRLRNHCLDCHGAHEPAYPSARPVFPPKDRYLRGRGVKDLDPAGLEVLGGKH